MTKKNNKLKKNKEDDIAEFINSLASSTAKGFENVHKQMDKRFALLEKEMNKRFDAVDQKFDNVYTILDNHTKLLLNNRAEKAATIYRFERIEGDIVKIKKKVKMV